MSKSSEYKTISNEIWEEKAKAFVVRCVRQLWGKKAEDIHSWLFKHEFSNKFIQSNMFGWNKKQTSRSMEKWGVEFIDQNVEELIIPPGVVIPHIVDECLLKVYLIDFEKNNDIFLLPGSHKNPVILGNSGENLYICDNIIDGYFIFQEKGELGDVLILDNYCEASEEYLNSIFVKYGQIKIFSNDLDKLDFNAPSEGVEKIKIPGVSIAESVKSGFIL